MDDQTIGADIENLVSLLNEQFTNAHRAGLKVSAASSDALTMMAPQPTRLTVKVWRETVVAGDRRPGAPILRP